MGHIQNSAVTTTKIADGAVTNAKILGPIGTDKLTTYAGELVVHGGPADGITSFNTLTAAVAAAPGSGWTLIRILPGTYSGDVACNGNIVFAGSGTQATVINGNITMNNGSALLKDVTAASINASAGGVEIRDSQVNSAVFARYYLTVANSWIGSAVGSYGPTNIKGSKLAGGGTLTLYDSYAFNTIVDTEIDPPMGGTAVAVVNTNSPGSIAYPTLFENVRIESGGAVGISLSQASYIQVRNSTISGSQYGISLDQFASIVDVRGSTLTGGTAAVGQSSLAANTINLVNTQVGGPATDGNLGTTKLFGCFDTSVNAIANQ